MLWNDATCLEDTLDLLQSLSRPLLSIAPFLLPPISIFGGTRAPLLSSGRPTAPSWVKLSRKFFDFLIC